MKQSLFTLLFTLLFFGCSKQPEILFDTLPNTYLLESDFNKLPNFEEENYDTVFESFKNNCRTKKAKKIYADLCAKLENVVDKKSFLLSNFSPYMITTEESKEEGLLTGYYEATLNASKKRSSRYKYPIYATPNDLISIDLSSIYPELKKYRLRGKLKGNKIVPYDSRAQSQHKKLNAKVICYCDSKVDKFFLEIQGSGRAILDDGSQMFIGYSNQNGHKYRAIGRYLVKINALKIKDVSLQSIRAWLDENPSRVDEVLNYNASLVFFDERKQGATGSLGLELMPKRSVAVDRRYIPLGSMLYLSARVGADSFNKVVFAQDTGGAIKNPIRADLFLGAGEEALEIAGKLKSPLKLWILLPKNMKKRAK